MFKMVTVRRQSFVLVEEMTQIAPTCIRAFCFLLKHIEIPTKFTTHDNLIMEIFPISLVFFEIESLSYGILRKV